MHNNVNAKLHASCIYAENNVLPIVPWSVNWLSFTPTAFTGRAALGPGNDNTMPIMIITSNQKQRAASFTSTLP